MILSNFILNTCQNYLLVSSCSELLEKDAVTKGLIFVSDGIENNYAP